MGKPTDIQIVNCEVSIEELRFRSPLKFGGRVVSHYRIVNVQTRVRTRGGREAVGFGSMPIGHVWSWPTTLPGSQTEHAMEALSHRVAKSASERNELMHALDHGWELCEALDGLSAEVVRDAQLPEPMPKLAALVAASPIDASIHDAFGKANDVNSYNALSSEFMNGDLSRYLGSDFAGEYLDAYTLREPKARMPLYHLVGALDPLTPEDVTQPIGDGLPEHLGEWIDANGLTHLKIKLAGDNLDWDVDRVARVESVVREKPRPESRSIQYSLDFNEKCQEVDYVLAFLDRVKQIAPGAWNRVQYIEQPTHRDLAKHRIPMHPASAIKPVVIDESLVDLESLLLARELGYTGVALKACKGQTESLLSAAAAQKYGMFLCVQDLTCPGASFLQSAELAARIPSVAAIEGNGRQYCPEGNRGWQDRFPGLFRITDGTVETACLNGVGLGH